MHQAAPLLEMNQDIKILLLVRDPRAIRYMNTIENLYFSTFFKEVLELNVHGVDFKLAPLLKGICRGVIRNHEN